MKNTGLGYGKAAKKSKSRDRYMKEKKALDSKRRKAARNGKEPCR